MTDQTPEPQPLTITVDLSPNPDTIRYILDGIRQTAARLTPDPARTAAKAALGACYDQDDEHAARLLDGLDDGQLAAIITAAVALSLHASRARKHLAQEDEQDVAGCPLDRPPGRCRALLGYCRADLEHPDDGQPQEAGDEYDTDPDTLRRNLNEVITSLVGRPPAMTHTAVWARVHPVLRIFREKLAEQQRRADEQKARAQRAEAEAADWRAAADRYERQRDAADRLAKTAEARAADLRKQRDEAARQRDVARTHLGVANAEAAEQRHRADEAEAEQRRLSAERDELAEANAVLDKAIDAERRRALAAEAEAGEGD